jgi:hypothetical protein
MEHHIAPGPSEAEKKKGRLTALLVIALPVLLGLALAAIYYIKGADSLSGMNSGAIGSGATGSGTVGSGQPGGSPSGSSGTQLPQCTADSPAGAPECAPPSAGSTPDSSH